MEKSMSTPKKHHILILSSLSIHFSSFPLLIAVVEEVLERGRCRGEGERHSSRKNEQKGKGTALGRGSVPLGLWGEGFRLGPRGGLVC